MQKLHVDIIMYLFCLNENHWQKNYQKNLPNKIVIIKNHIAIRIAEKVSRYIDASPPLLFARTTHVRPRSSGRRRAEDSRP